MNEYLNQIEISGITYDLVASGGTGSGVTPAEVQEMIEDYTYDKQTIDDKIASGGGAPSSAITVLSGDVITLSGDVKTVSGDVKTISGDVITLSGDVISLSGDVQIISGDIITLSAETNALETKLDTLSGDVMDNEQVVSAALNDLKENKLDASAFTEALDEKQDKLTAGIGITIIDNVISATGGSASGVTSGDVQNMLSAYTYDKATIDDKISDVSGDVITISGDVITLSGDVITLSGNVYQKDETSSKTEIDDALALKVNVVDNQVPEYGLMDKLVEEEGRVKVIYTADSYSNGAVYFYGMAISMGSLPGWRYDVIVVDKNDNVVFSGASAWGHDTVENDYFKLSGYYEHPDDYYLEATIEAKNGYRFTRVGNPSGAGELGNSYTLKYYTQVTKFDSYQSSSAITYNIYPELDKIESEKQDKLTAGIGITIVDNVISATGGSASGVTSGDVQNMLSAYTYDKATIDDALELKQDVMSGSSHIEIESGTVINLIIDDHLDSGSTNPVVNSAVTDAVIVEGTQGSASGSTSRKVTLTKTFTYDENVYYFRTWGGDSDFENFQLILTNSTGGTQTYTNPYTITSDDKLDYVYNSNNGRFTATTKDDWYITKITYKDVEAPSHEWEYKWGRNGYPEMDAATAIHDYIYPELNDLNADVNNLNDIKQDNLIAYNNSGIILSGYHNREISAVINPLTINQYISGKTSSAQVQTMIDEAVSGKVDTDDFIVVRDTVVDVVNAVNDINDDIASLSGDSGTLKLSAFTNAEYDSTNKVINFYNLTGGTVASIDATDFIKDGMVQDVQIVEIGGVSYLRITFNTESGQENIDIDLSQIFDANNYYTKTEVYNKTEVNNIVSNKIQCLSEAEWEQTSGSTVPDTLYLIY